MHIIKKSLLALGFGALLMGAVPAIVTAQNAAPAQQETETPWYLNLDYAGYNFEVPAGSMVEKGSSMIVKYPDGSFGVSLTNVEERGVNQKRAFEVCQRLASQMKLPDAHVKKIHCGKAGGAIATSTLEGQEVSVLVLPYNGNELTIVMLASPQRHEWAQHFIETLTR